MIRAALLLLTCCLAAPALAQVEIDSMEAPPAVEDVAPPIIVQVDDPGLSPVGDEPILVEAPLNPIDQFLASEAQRDPAEALSYGADSAAYWLDEGGEAAVRAALTAYYEYQTSGYQHRRQVFDWQLISSKIIFWITIVLVSAGLLLSLYQFRAGMRAAAVAQDTVRETLRTAPPEQVARLLEVSQASGKRAKSDLELSMTGVKVSSDVMGLIILVISLAFFYLYLVHVYPITEITQAASSQ